MPEPLFGKTLTELKELVQNLKLPSFTAGQVADWLYKKDIDSIDEMTNLSKKGRDILSKNYTIGLMPPSDVQTSSDGTKKYVFPVSGKNFIESAFIPELNRNTLCVSSQAGCMRHCVFCMTGRQGLHGNLTAGEIVNQIKSLPERDSLTNLVYMGMGEPFDNFHAVMSSLEIITSPWGLDWSPKRITVSTIGIVPAVRKFLNSSSCNLAISLHSPFENERRRLMPIEKAQPFKEIIEEIKSHEISRYRKISIEYILFKGVNDSTRHVNELAKVLSGVRCRVNLIHFHPIPGTELQGVRLADMELFRDELNKKGILATIRKSRGQDISAACGMLSTNKSTATE